MLFYASIDIFLGASYIKANVVFCIILLLWLFQVQLKLCVVTPKIVLYRYQMILKQTTTVLEFVKIDGHYSAIKHISSYI